ncbi:MAG: CoA pyrophosphatase [Saprospiraceae bacterium]
MEQFLESLALRLLNKLPGSEAHLQMAPFPERLREIPAHDHSEAAVMIVLMKESDQFFFPLIQRNPSSELDPHKGQIALPGGRFEEGDHNLVFTALRETYEEIGIDNSQIKIIGSLSPLYIPVSKNLVQPYIGWCEKKPILIKQDKEIHEIFSCTLEAVLNLDNLTHKVISTSYANQLKVPGFLFGDRWVWGATAMILAEFAEILRELKV